MSIFELFEYMRRKHADWYTAHPFEQLSDDQLTRLAEEQGMTVEALKQQMSQPRIEMTCPLCGQPSTHLVSCKGCGGDAWGGEWELAHGEGFRDQLRTSLREAVSRLETTTEAQAEYAAKHAYDWGGCLICATDCWHHTLPVNAYQTCPLNLLAERTLEPDRLPRGMYPILFNAPDAESLHRSARAWIKAGWDRWVEIWNTVPSPAREAVAAWRARLLDAAWSQPPPSSEKD